MSEMKSIFCSEQKQVCRSNERGVALIITLLLLAILIAVISQLAFETKTEVRVSQTYKGNLQNHAAQETAVALARKYLMIDQGIDEKLSEDDNSHEYDAPDETWATRFKPQEMGNTTLYFRIEDEARRLDINQLVEIEENDPEKLRKNNEQFRMFLRLFDSLNIEDTLLFRLKDYVDKDEEGAFETRNARNHRLTAPQELLRIKGFTSQLLYGTRNVPPLLRYITLWSDGTVNVNTASRVVLMSLSDEMTAQWADEIINYRSNFNQNGNLQVFKSKTDLLKIESLPNKLLKDLRDKSSYWDVKATYYSVFTKLVSEGTTETARTVLKLKGASTAPEVIWFNRNVTLEIYNLFQDPEDREESMYDSRSSR